MNSEQYNNFDLLNRIDEIKDQEERFKALLSLLPDLAPESLGEVIKVAEKFSLSKWHEILIAISLHITPVLFKEILNNSTHYNNRGATLINLSSHIPHTLFADTLKITKEINRSNISSAVLKNLIPRIDDPKLILEALSLSLDIDRSASTEVNSLLQQKLQQMHDLDLFPESKAFKLAENFLSASNYYSCAQTLVIIIPYLSSNLLLKVLEFTEEILSAKSYFDCDSILVALIPYVSFDSDLLLQILKIARRINDPEVINSRINALTILESNISENYLNFSDNNFLLANWSDDSEYWKKQVANKFREYINWCNIGSYNYKTNLAVWRAIGNEVIDKTYCQAPRSRAKVLALLYYYFNESQRTQIFKELLEAIDEIPAQSCKARSYIALVSYLPSPEAREIIQKTISIVKEIYEDIINNQLPDSEVDLISAYTHIQQEYTEIQILENQLQTLTISNLKKEILKLIETADIFLFPPPGSWWQPNMINGLPPVVIVLCNRWVKEAYMLACGAKDEDKEDREKLITATGVSEVALASTIANLLIAKLALPATLATVIAAIAVKRFFSSTYEVFCDLWEKNLPENE